MRSFRCAALGAVAVVGFASVASAADMPVKASPIAPLPVAYNWTGFYGGLNAGGAWTRSNVNYTETGAFGAGPDVAFSNALGSPTLTQAGFTGGGQVGYNYQVGQVVWGIETDINYLHTSGNYSATGALPVGVAVVSSTVNVTTDWLYTLRGRIGFAADRALFYTTGGLAVGNENFSQNFFHAATGSSEAGTISSTKAGWTAGAGIEYAFTKNMSGKVEYLYVDLGSVSFNSANNLFPTFTAANSANLKESIVRVGVNWKFGG